MTSIEYKKKVGEEAQKYLDECLGNVTFEDAGFGDSAAAGQDDDGVTIPSGGIFSEHTGRSRRKEPQDAVGDNEDGDTLDFSSGKKKDYYVTGWLVCMAGTEKGHSYNLYYGYNTIGQSSGNQVCIPGDDGICDKTHCSVVYEERNNRFYLLPEENTRTYLSGAEVTEPTQLKAGDMLQLGQTELVFIPFCQGSRKWDKKEMREFLSGRR